MSKRSLSSLALFLFTIVAVFGVRPSAWSQEVTANIIGTVTDPSGAPISGANVTATDTQRGTVRNAKTDANGAYSILRVPVGSYAVTVAAAGFQKAVYPAFT